MFICLQISDVYISLSYYDKIQVGNCDLTIIVYTLIWCCLFLNKFGYVYAVLKMIFFFYQCFTCQLFLHESVFCLRTFLLLDVELTTQFCQIHNVEESRNNSNQRNHSKIFHLLLSCFLSPHKQMGKKPPHFARYSNQNNLRCQIHFSKTFPSASMKLWNKITTESFLKRLLLFPISNNMEIIRVELFDPIK